MSKPHYTGTLELDDTEPSYGDRVHFTATTDAPGAFVHLQVEQNGRKVAEGWASVSALGGPTFGLYSPQWTSGAADATADLVYFTGTGPHGPQFSKPLASVAFHVAA